MSFSGRKDRIRKQEFYFLQARATPVVVSSLYPLLHSFLSCCLRMAVYVCVRLVAFARNRSLLW